MRKKRRNAGNGVLIDLTSLLDVIFILLLVVICGFSKKEIDTAEAKKSLDAAMAEAEADAKAYSDLMETENDLQKLTWSASIVIPYEPDEITTRHIKVLKEGEELKTFDLVGNDVNESVNEFRNCLTEYVESNSDRPVILSLNENDENILYRDERAIKEILDELSAQYHNVYLKGNISEE